jgi:prolipoprotein diacylglyceryltransferase
VSPAVLAAISLGFDPSLIVGDRAVRLETLAVAAAVLAGLAWAALVAGRTAAFGGWIGTPAPGHEHVPAPDEEVADDEPWHLRRDDLLFVVLGAVPGAVIFGRAFYAVGHLDYYGAYPGALLDPSLGSASLSGAVVGATLSGVYVAALLDAPVGRWLHVLIKPALLTLALVKLAGVLGGSGQGAPSDLPWATAYLGTGPWGSLNPAMPAHPAQVYEAATTIVVLLAVAALGRFSGLRHADGRLFAVGIALWAFGRGAVASTWRDSAVAGPLKAEQILCLVIAAGYLAAAGMATVRQHRVVPPPVMGR